MGFVAGDDEDYPEIDEEDGSVAGRVDGSAVCAERFEQLLIEDYGDEEIGAMDDDDEIEGHMTMEDMEAILDEYIEDRENTKAKLESIYEPIKGKYDNVPRTIEE